MTEKNNLSKKLIIIIILVNAIASVLVTLTTLFVDYSNELKRVEETVELIRMNNKESLAITAWNFDKELINVQLKGLLHFRYLNHVQFVAYDESETIDLGDPISPIFEKRFTMPIQYKELDLVQDLGRLNLIFDMKAVWIDLIKKMLVVFMSQIIKMILVSIVLFYILQKILIKPIEDIAKNIRGFKLGKEAIPLPQRTGAFSESKDELDSLFLTVNEISHQLDKKHKELTQMNAELDDLANKRAAIILEQQRDLENERRFASLGRIAGRISHEINSPLTAAIMRVELLKENEALMKDPEASQSISKLELILDNIKNIVSSIKAFYRENNKELAQQIDLSKNLLELHNKYFNELEKKGVRFVLKDMTSKDVFISVPPLQFSQVLIQLINNAAEFIEKEPEKWIELSIQKQGHTVSITVTDSGPGISDEIQEKIFSPYFSTKKQGKESAEGAGLGLTICKKFIEEMNGTIELDTKSPHTSFVIKLETL